jgi:large subunit ribosomal protein L27e
VAESGEGSFVTYCVTFFECGEFVEESSNCDCTCDGTCDANETLHKSNCCFSLNFFFVRLPTEAGKVVIVLQGRHAGKKAVVVKTFDDGNSDRRFSHCLIAGLARNPRKVTKAMPKEKAEKRSKQMKPFVKYVNVRHIFPTRYVVDLDLKKAVDEADLVDPERKVDVKKNLKKLFYDRYLNQKEVTSEKKAQGSSYFFQKLRF